ncbi:alkaline phosphatase PhoX [Enterovirga sp. GCM10030262]|uniref:alkaline phosphatase PhoX n=1 Tax=Enterovirga sp. GCM10030262 TaxID=3273391 RepID=UPI003621F63E
MGRVRAISALALVEGGDLAGREVAYRRQRHGGRAAISGEGPLNEGRNRENGNHGAAVRRGRLYRYRRRSGGPAERRGRQRRPALYRLRALRRSFVGPKECEITGVDSTPDGRTLFVNIQHPGEETDGARAWPASQIDGAASSRPRPATIVITKDDGGVVGL